MDCRLSNVDCRILAATSALVLIGACAAGGRNTAAVVGDQQNAALAAMVKAEVALAMTTAVEAAVVSLRQEFKLTNAPTTTAPAGRDSTVWNINFQDAAGKAGWLFVPTIAAGWWASRKKTLGALDTVIRAIEIGECETCKRAVQAQENRTADQRVQVVSQRMNGG